MRAILISTGRSLLRHWPVLLAWYLGGLLVHALVIEVAGFVGAYSATLGFLVLPIAVLARLVSMVAMFVVLRESLAELGAIAPLPDSPRERRRSFLSALLASILPFVAIYWAQGMLREDVNAYLARAMQEFTDRVWLSLDDAPIDNIDTGINVPISIWTIAIIVVAFAARWVWARWSSRLPGWLASLAVYFEIVWVFFSVLVIGDITDKVQGWIDTRTAVVAFEQMRTDLLDAIAPLAWLWDGVLWLVGLAGPILLAPLAWLTVAGVVYGQAIVAERLTVEIAFVERLRKQTEVVPAGTMRRMKDLSGQVTGRFAPIGRAFALMWRAGPVLIASYAFLYIGVKTLETYLQFGITRLIGPHDVVFWSIALPLVSMLPLLIIEPLRIAVVAGAYDATLGQLRRQHEKASGASEVGASEVDAEVDASGLAAGQDSTENLMNLPSPAGSTSSQNGPSTSSGTTNPTTSL
ncbi:hypothetical protein [Microbacterium sp. H1-D42]|uniref:hypothetical protein n=1 Tax=Microbacterium sp. H1-D42 TaxID=2925844 RepID=UPI001F52EC55|nr:hypothetical protein [Microbacterium sp. H1-D42]UNK71323.1 hypothetical protein MNR00_02380 [Microbacterium sp. H1-D42]